MIMAGRRNIRFALASLVAIALFFVLREHWAHSFGVLPYAILLLCPLMHLFHGSHGHNHSDRQP
jgi:hypothetical protein